jgi:hypothetical protein
MTTAVKRACDACHRRKVKCDGINPCRNCSASQLACTYNAIPQKKGPKGSRAKVISELRETQRQTSLSAKVQNRMNGITGPNTSPTLAPNPGLLTPEIVRDCIEFFFANMYPTMPILHRQRLEQQSLYMDQSLDTYCLLTSLSAFMMLQPGMAMPGSDPYSLDSMPGANIVSGTLLMEETIRVRKGYEYLDSPTLNTLCTSYFLFCCYYGLDMHDKAWFHLREATTMIHLIGMNKEETYLQYDAIEASRRRRLFWLFFVTERYVHPFLPSPPPSPCLSFYFRLLAANDDLPYRAYALQRHRPLTLQATVNLPTPADDPTDPLAHLLSGFSLLVNLFRSFDDSFVALWNKARGDCSASYLSTLQKQLQEVLPSYLNSPGSQLAEMQMDQQWLKNMQWQMSLASGNSTELYSIDIGRDLLPVVSHFPGNLGLLGLGLIEKLCELCSSLTEFLAMQPASRDPFSVGPREHLHQMLNVLSVLRNGDHRFLPLLLSKAHDVLPRLVNPMLQNAPDNACNIDIFDGFGNAGMAQPAMFQPAEYETKFGLDHVSTDGTASAAVKSETKSPFSNSSAVMSPGIDIPHGMPEMVMNQMTSSPGTLGPQHPSMTSFHNLSPPLNMTQQALMANQMATGLGDSMGSAMMPRQQPQRANSFATSGAPQQLRTVADFHVLQRANTDMSLGISMGPDMDFNTLPR